MTESTLIEALEGAKELFVEMKRLANELAAVKEENEALKRENERLEHRLNCEIDHYNRLEHSAEELSTMLLKESEEKERLEEQLQLLRETSSDDVIFCVKRPTTL